MIDLVADPQPPLARGIVVATANDEGLIDVVIPAFDDQQKFNDIPFMPRGDAEPGLGAQCLVAFDDQHAPWVIAWYGANADQPAPSHARKAGPTGKTDGGGIAVDARGVTAPSTAETWENVGSSGSYSAGELVPIAPWIKPILEFAVDHGWDGTINEGWRSLETQQYYWDHAEEMGLVRGVTVAAPGTSNHGGLDYPAGAIDIDDQEGMAAAMAEYDEARKLVWYGPRDAPHWSASGR